MLDGLGNGLKLVCQLVVNPPKQLEAVTMLVVISPKTIPGQLMDLQFLLDDLLQSECVMPHCVIY